MASGQSRAWLPNTSLDAPDAMQAIASFGGLWVAPGSPYQSMSGVKTHFTSEAISKGARSGTVKSPDGPLDVTLGNPLEARIETRGPNPDGLAVELHALLPDLAPDQAQRIMEEAHQTCPYSRALRGEASVALIADTPALEKIPDQDLEVFEKLPARTQELSALMNESEKTTGKRTGRCHQAHPGQIQVKGNGPRQPITCASSGRVRWSSRLTVWLSVGGIRWTSQMRLTADKTLIRTGLQNTPW